MARPDMELVREFVASHSEPAFAELVARHLGLVHSAAFRQTGDAHLAQEISQAVFIILARKAGSLGPDTILSAWLYRTTRYVAVDALKMQRRRQRREQEGYMQSTLNEPDAGAWEQLAPLLDDSMNRLSEGDRTALMLRFFEDKTAAEIAAALKVNEEAAQKRVARALEKLRKIFAQRGVTLTATAIAGAVSANSVQAVPAGLAATISTAAISGITATPAAVLAAKIIFMTTFQKTIVTAAVLVAFITPLIIKQREVAHLGKEIEALRWEKASLVTALQHEGTATISQVHADVDAPKVETSMPADLLPAEVVAKMAALLADRKPMDKTRMEAWAKLFAQIPSNKTGEALQSALQLTDHEIRTAITQSLFRNWVETNPRAALAFANANFQGQEKSDAIRDALRGWASQDPDEALAAWQEQVKDPTGKLSWGGSRSETVEALFDGLARNDFPKAVASLKDVDGDVFSSALKGLGTAAGRTEEGRTLFLNQLKQLSDQPVSYEAMTSFMSSWAQSDLPSARTWVESQPAGKQHDYALRQVGLTYVQHDPKAGADWWINQAAQVEEERSHAYFDIAQTWAGSDIKAAAEWLNQQPRGDSLDSGFSGFADVAVSHDPLIALQWAAAITEHNHRDSVLAHTWQKWQRSDRAAAEQFLDKSGWSAELVARARGNGQ